MRPFPCEQRSGSAVAVVRPRRTFWPMAVASVPISAVKQRHACERVADKRSRFMVRNRLRQDGVTSNLFPVHLGEPGSAEAVSRRVSLYAYDMYAAQLACSALRAEPSVAGGSQHANALEGGPRPSLVSVPSEQLRRVSPRQTWRAIRRFLLQRLPAPLPPLVQCHHTLYTTSPLPAELLQVPREFYDLGWRACKLRLKGQHTYADLSPHLLQELVNKIVLWAARHGPRGPRAAGSGNPYKVVRAATGKLVCMEGGISSGAMRLFNGVTVQAIFVNAAGACAQSERGPLRGDSGEPASTTARPVTTDLATLSEGVVGPERGVRFWVEALLRVFTYKGKGVESYTIADSSGTYLASLWEPAEPQALKPGKVYTARGVRVRVFPSRSNFRLIEFFGDSTHFTDEAEPSDGTVCVDTETGARTGAEVGAASHSCPGLLCLKIDAKGTMAAETSLLDDVVKHFGPGPYDAETQQRIAQSIEGAPVVSSYSCAQGVVRFVRFVCGMAAKGRGASTDITPAVRGLGDGGGGPAGLSHRTMDPGLISLLPYLDAGQPWAVFPDHTVLPLQVLHYCYNPEARSWQEASVATFSLLPERRMAHIMQYRHLLADGLREWGLYLAAQPCHTKLLSVLPQPQKVQRAHVADLPALRPGALRHPPPPAFPTSVLVIGIAGARCSAAESGRLSLTVQHAATSFRTKMVYLAPSEEAAVRFMMEQLLTPATAVSHPAPQLSDPNACAILLTLERHSRATRWVMAECLSRGVMPICLPPVATPKHANLLCGNAKRQLREKFEVNPLRGVDIAKEVPVVAQKRVLMVGIDACHTNVVSTGSVVGILYTPQRNHLIPTFWRHEARGREVQQVGEHFEHVLAQAVALYDGLDEVIIFQDGDVFSKLKSIKARLAAHAPRCGLTFLCLHKRSNIRFVYDKTPEASGIRPQGQGGAGSAYGTASPRYNNVVKGVVIPDLTPVPLTYKIAAPTFFLQTHDSNMSTARIVQYTVHHTSPILDISDVQQLANVMANVAAPQATKLPISTRCAHRLADQAERLLDAVPQFKCELIPSPLNERLWFI